MELIVKTYGKFLLEAAAALLFFLLIFFGVRDTAGNIGFFRVLGSQLKETASVYGADFSVCVEESQRRMPEIFYKKEGALAAGTYTAAELFGAEDCNGRALPVQIQEITYMGLRHEAIYDEETDRLSFPAAGQYMVQLRTMDAWNNIRTSRICVPVNEKKEGV